MDNNYENLTPDVEEVVLNEFAASENAVTEEGYVDSAEEAVALAEEYTVSSDISENLPELQTEKKGKKAKKPKKEKASK